MVNPRHHHHRHRRPSSSASESFSLSSSSSSSSSSFASSADAPVAMSTPVIAEAVPQEPAHKEKPTETTPHPQRVWRFLDTEETCHFFSTEMVISTNDVLQLEVEEDAIELPLQLDDGDDAASPQHERVDVSEPEAEDRVRSKPHSPTDTTPSNPAQCTYEGIFSDFDDLYLPTIARNAPKTLRKRRAEQCKNAAHVLQAFCSDLLMGQNYVYRKRSEFLRVCFQRAIDMQTEPVVKKSSVQSSPERAPVKTSAFQFQCLRLERPVDVTVPELHPRKWPHLPFRDPLEWRENALGAIDFAKRVGDLPPGSLLYEPIDINAFTSRIMDVLAAEGIDVWSSKQGSTAELSHAAIATLAACFAMAVQLQSFSLLLLVGDIFLRYGAATALSTESVGQEVFDTVTMSITTLQSSSQKTQPPATYPRALVAQWKMCSYQPSTSDAMATDGLYLYIYGRSGLLKVGTGRGATLRDYVYDHNRKYCRGRDAERSWLCLIGNYLYCRSIAMPSSHIDRISVSDLSAIDELFFAPPQQVPDLSSGANPVYAVVTDGTDLFTIHSIDSQKRNVRKKSRAKKPSSKDAVKALLARATGDASATTSSQASSSIAVGDRVVRGPQWKWGLQDGEQGSPGTVQRISTWGGVKGCGITVRWDKNQRVNTYRWGAEGSYDLIVVIEKPGGVLEKKPLPASASGTKDDPSVPRHLFVVNRYRVSELVRVVDLGDEAMNSFLGLSSKRQAQARTLPDEKYSLQTSIHEHTMCLSSATTTAWMCDGGTPDCLGDNSGVRYRCEHGCDFDLCEVCLASTLITKAADGSISQATSDEAKTAESSETLKQNADVSASASADQPAVDDNEGHVTEPTPEESEDAEIDELTAFWCGLYSRQECVVAYQRCGQSLELSMTWMSNCGDELKKRVIMTSINSVILESPPNSSGLDPVLLVAGSFYVIDGQVCIVSPPGLFQSEARKRSAQSSDAAWFFSLADGTLRYNANSPTLLRSVPAGSPVCVDLDRRRILVFSGHLNCVEEYVMAKQPAPLSELFVHASDQTLASIGTRIYRSLGRFSGQRWALPAYKRPWQGLQDCINQLQLESCVVDATSGSVRANAINDANTNKVRTRQIKKIRLRLQEFEKIGVADDRGYYVPYCLDFRDVGLGSLLCRLDCVINEVRVRPQSVASDANDLLEVITIWRGFLQDCFQADLRLRALPEWFPVVNSVVNGLLDVTLARVFRWDELHPPASEEVRVRSQVVQFSQDVLMWGVEIGLFSHPCRWDLLVKGLNEILAEPQGLPDNYMKIMQQPDTSGPLQSALDCHVSLVKRILTQNADATDGGIADLLGDTSQAQVLIDTLFRLSAREVFHGARGGCSKDRLDGYSPVDKALLALFNGCAIDVMVKVEAVDSTRPRERRVSSTVGAESLLQVFASQCFRTCELLLKSIGDDFDERCISHSMCFKLLPLVFAMVSNGGSSLWASLDDDIFQLIGTINRLREDEAALSSHLLPETRVVESPHPYNRGQASMRKVVRIPGATCLHIQFDPQCSTSGEADFVFVTPGHEWFHSERVPFGENGIGDAGGCFFGSRENGNWPHPSGGISIWGDTATIMLCSTSQDRGGSAQDETHRWGLRCFVRGISLPDATSWKIDTLLAMKHTVTTLSQRRLMASQEALASPLLRQTHRERRALDSLKMPREAKKTALVREILAATSNDPMTEGAKMAARIDSTMKSQRRSGGQGTQTPVWQQALRTILATVSADALQFSGSDILVDESVFQCVLRGMTKIEQWMVRRVQLLKEWHFLREDNMTIVQMTERLVTDIGRLKALCVLKGVNFSDVDMKRNISELHDVIVSERSSTKSTSVDFHKEVAQTVLGKAEYALDHYLAADIGDSQAHREDRHVDEASATIVEYITSEVSVADVRLAEHHHAIALGRGLDTLQLLQKADHDLTTTGYESMSIAGSLGASWTRGDSKRLKFDHGSPTKSMSRARMWCKKTCSTIKNESICHATRLAAAVDFLAAYDLFAHELGASEAMEEFVSSMIDLILELVICQVSSKTERLGSSGYSMKELVWMSFRCGIETLFSDGSAEAALSILQETIGRLRSLSPGHDDARHPAVVDALGSVMKIATSHVDSILAHANVGSWVELCVSQLKSSPHGNHSSQQLGSLRMLVALEQSSSTAMDEPAFASRDFAGLLLEKIGILQSSLAHRVDESENKSKDCCVILFDNDKATSKITDAFDKVEGSGLELVCLPPSLIGAEMPTYVPGNTVRTLQEIDDSSDVVHRNVRCDSCNQSPIRGYRFKCSVCANYDLCTNCYLNQSVHDVDHQFVRHSSPSSTGELLQPRSKANGAIVPEAALIGSLPWTASVARALLEATGYVVLCRGSSELCLSHAKMLSENGFAVTVMEWPDVQDLDAFYDWESFVQVSFEPGAARLSRRSVSTASSTSSRKANRSVLKRFNERMAGKRDGHVVLDAQAEISELIALTRAVLNHAADNAYPLLSATVESLSNLGTCVPLSSAEDRATYFRTLGLINVLGGFAEPLRLGASVTLRDSTQSGDLVGVVKKHSVGSGSVEIIARQVTDLPCGAEAILELEAPIKHVEVTPIVPVDQLHAVVASTPHFFSTFAAVLKVSHKLLRGTPTELAADAGRVAAMELVVSWLRMYMTSMASFPSLLDKKASAGNGNMALLLFQLAKTSRSDTSFEVLDKKRELAWAMRQAVLGEYRYNLATRPIGSDCLRQDGSCIYGPGANGLSDSTEYVFNMYAYSSRAELPKKSGRNKLLEYWEKNVIPAIESYVAGSFKSYEMDYFFAQLREPLREGNPAAAMKIAFTLCDGHVPSGCHYPDPDTDWTALQIDDIEVGARYLVTGGSGSTPDLNDWPAEMHWTVGQSGVVRNVYPSGLVLMQLRNPQSSRLEHWWYQVDFLASVSSRSGLSERSVDTFDHALADLMKIDMDLMGVMARKCVFAMLKQAPEQFPLVSDRPSVKNHFNLVDILRMAAGAELGFESDTILGTTDAGRVGVIDGDAAHSASRYELMGALQYVLTKRFEYTPPGSLAEAPPFDDQAAATTMGKSGTSKYVKTGKTAGNVFVTSTAKSVQSTVTTHALDDHLAAVKYRYNLMEALVHELKRALDSSSAFLQQNAFMVASDSPPKPLIMLSVPGASCLVISFAVHPVLMDLPAGSSLEFFHDEACTSRIFGYFGDKRGLNFLPPLVVPGEKCFVRASQASYARYKFRVDPLTSDFGLALWIAEEVYQRITSTLLTSFELESIVSSVLNSITDYLVGSVAALAPCTKGVMSQVLTKMINFAISRSLSNAVPLSKLSVLTRDLAVAYDHELSAQKGLFSLPTQQLAELLSAVEEVSRLRGAAPTIVLATAWWPSFVKMATFTRVLTHKRDPAVSTDIVSRISCGRTPVEDVDAAWKDALTRDLLSERMVLLQRVPRTQRIPELEVALSRFVHHIALEECGEADDQTVLSATEVFRFGILAKVVHLPVNECGETIGYAIVDVGRHEIVPKLLARLAKEKFEFEGDPTEEDKELAETMNGSSQDPPVIIEDAAAEQLVQTSMDDNVWACGVCTLENPISEVECAACGSPIPSELVEMAIRRQSQQHTARDTESSQAHESEEGGESSTVGWECEACTLVNPWALFECVACGSERGDDVVEPAPRGEDGVVAEDVSDDVAAFHIFSGVGLADLMRLASAKPIKQVNRFLVEIFTRNRATELSRDLECLLQAEAAVPLGDGGLVSKLAANVGAKAGSDEIDAQKLRATLLEVAIHEPVKAVDWLRESGYDLHFELNHYPVLEAARASQAKWTYQMDAQLVAFARQIGAHIGVLSLMDLCPSHITAASAPEGSVLATLETRDLRLRFALLKAFNKTALDGLPLVNLRNLSDPNAMRARLVSARQLLFPAVKIRFLADTQDNANLAQSNLLESNVKRPVVTLDRRRVVSQRSMVAESLSLRDPATSLFASTMSQLSQIKPSVLRAKRPTGASDPFVAFIVIFAGENVVGEGGPYRQLFNDIATELLATGSPLFLPTQNNAMKIGEFRDRYLPRPSSTSKAMLEMFEFVGVLMGCCIRTGVRLNIRLAPIVWKMLVKQSLSIADLEHVDWSVCESLKILEAAASGENAAVATSLGDIYYESFTTTLTDGTTIELKPNGVSIPVTKSNCREYVRLAKAARFQECKPQVDAMLRGIGTIVPVQLLQLCTWSELQQWVCGSLAIDVELLKRHTLYSSGMTPDRFPHLDMFWRVLSNFSEENKRRFINFAWGQDTLPADDAEFDRTHTRLLVKAPPVTATNQDLLLPKADTCFFNIELPAYSTEAIMREKLLLAITMCTSMDGDEQTGRMDLYFSTDELDDEHME